MVEADERELILEAKRSCSRPSSRETMLVFTMTPGGLPRCIHVLMHVNTDRTAADIKHVYLHAAQTLRPEA